MPTRAIQLVTLLSLVGSAASAQLRFDTTLIKPVGPRTLIGFVGDTNAEPIARAEVYVPSIRRNAFVDSRGMFRFDDVEPGSYEVAARHFGYYPQVRSTMMETNGGVITFALVPRSQSLPAVVSSASRGGLNGVVSDLSRNAIAGASIYAIATGHRTTTDSSGHFVLGLKPGKHILQVQRQGYGAQLFSVRIPKDSGRQVAVRLRPSSSGPSAMEKIAVSDLRMRLLRRRAVHSSILTREDIEIEGWTELTQIVNAVAGRPIDPGCWAVIDGGPRQDLIWAVRADEIGTVEVYERHVEIYRVGNVPPRMPSAVGARFGSECRASIYVWLRK